MSSGIGAYRNGKPIVDATDPVFQAVVRQIVPQPGTTIPPEAGTTGAVGDDDSHYARANHTHEVRARRKRVTLVAGTGVDAGRFVARWVFDKPFATKPIIVCSPENDGGQPVIVEAMRDRFEQNAEGLWIAVTIRGQRAQALPALSGIMSIVGMVAALGNFNVFGASAAGVVVGLTAAQETPLPP